jgi:hypothetical protein
MGFVVYVDQLRTVLPFKPFMYLTKLAIARTNQTELAMADGWLPYEKVDRNSPRAQSVVMCRLRHTTGLDIESDCDNRAWRLEVDPFEIMFNHKVLAKFEADYTIWQIFRAGQIRS